MNRNKICFIMCANNDICVDECVLYIDSLSVPDGTEVEILTVKDGTSMLAGYREGYNCTDAEYIVFMHQDVFILNRFFIHDILDIFRSDDNIGMIGMVGAPHMSPDFIMWNNERIGNFFMKGDPTDYDGYRYDIVKDGYERVEVIDGFLMVYRRMKGKD